MAYSNTSCSEPMVFTGIVAPPGNAVEFHRACVSFDLGLRVDDMGGNQAALMPVKGRLAPGNPMCMDETTCL